MQFSRVSAVLLVAGCSASASPPPMQQAQPAPKQAPAPVAALRAEGPAALDRLLAEYDRLPARDPARERLAGTIDAVAAQRYAHVSRLYWHTDLDGARAAARAEGKPILSLRMLGRLDRDWSCANSRFFRVALYANREVSAYLREHFILHWSTEREVPRVTVDFGDGRVLETTIAGNSAHYVLDPSGWPVDVLPGLWGPQAFLAELRAAAPVAMRVAELGGPPRGQVVAAHHRARMEFAAKRWLSDGSGRIAAGGQSGRPSLGEAERVTVTKSMAEMPMVRALALGPEVAAIPDQAPMWEPVGAARAAESKLDAQSRALIARLAPSDWSRDGRALDGERLDALIAGFEKAMAADTALNRYKIRWGIHHWFANQQPGTDDLDRLNARIYTEVFLTPAADPWLGMATPGVFTGLPGDGILRSGPLARASAQDERRLDR